MIFIAVMDKFQFTDAIQNGIAIMRLDRHIGPDPMNASTPFIDGSYFAEEMYRHHSHGLKCQVRINSVGGNVIQGYNILEAVEMTGADTHCYGLAASMAGMILVRGKRRTCDSHAVALVHAASNKKMPGSPITASINNSLKTVLKERTKFTEDRINTMMDGTEDYTFDASEMLSNGMVDEVLPSNVKVGKTRVNASASELFAVYGSISDNLNTKSTMNWWKFLFNKASEEEGLAEMIALKNAKEKADADVVRLTAELAAKNLEVSNLKTQIENVGKVSVKEKATKLVTDAITAKAFVPKDEAEKASMIAMAENNFDLVEKMFKGMTPAKRETVASTVTNSAERSANVPNGGKTYEWLAQNDPDELDRIQENDPELFNRLADEYNQSKRNPAKA